MSTCNKQQYHGERGGITGEERGEKERVSSCNNIFFIF